MEWLIHFVLMATSCHKKLLESTGYRMAMTDTLALMSEDATQHRRCRYYCLARKTGLRAQPQESCSCQAEVEVRTTLAKATDIVVVAIHLVKVHTDLAKVAASSYYLHGPSLADIMAAGGSQGKVMDLMAANKEQKDWLAANLSTSVHNQEVIKATEAAFGSLMVEVGLGRISARVATSMDCRSWLDLFMATVHKLEYALGSY